MKKLLLASVLAIASFPGYAHAQEQPSPAQCHTPEDGCDSEGRPPARVTINPYGPPPIGWVYGPYTVCGELGCQVNVQADGLNVRNAPDGYPVMSLVNGVPLIPYKKEGNWLLVGTACDLTPTWAWSWTAGVPLMRCWVYF